MRSRRRSRVALAVVVAALPELIGVRTSAAAVEAAETLDAADGPAPQAPAAESDEAILQRHGKREARVHDPSSIVKCKDSHWLFATGFGIESWRSRDLQEWRRGPPVLTEIPEWVERVVPGHRGRYWAPEVIFHEGRYLLYYSVSRFGVNTSAIGLASSLTLDPDDPAWRWTDQGIVIESHAADDFNAIDPAVIRTAEGRLWMSFGSFWSGIQLVELDPATGKRLGAASPPRSVARYRAIEAPFIHERDSVYYLFVCWDRCCRGVDSTYNIRVGRSLDIGGPYLDKSGVDLLAGGGTLLLERDGPFIGPGHPSILEEDGRSWLACHFYDGTRRGRSFLAIAPLRWGEDGWPALEASPPGSPGLPEAEATAGAKEGPREAPTEGPAKGLTDGPQGASKGASSSAGPQEGAAGPSPAAQLEALRKEYSAASLGFRKATTDAERSRAVERLAPFARQFLDLAERSGEETPSVDGLEEAVRAMNAVDSLTQTAWDMNEASFPRIGPDGSPERVLALLLCDHAQSERLGPICERMAYGVRVEFETFLRAVLEQSPHRSVRGLACLSLAELLAARDAKLGLLQERPELAERYVDLLGKAGFEAFRRRGRAALGQEVEALLERAIAEYGDVQPSFGATVGERADASLFERRHLAVGLEAPDIDGEDQDGKPLKLSGYRGKVVLLDFWQEQ